MPKFYRRSRLLFLITALLCLLSVSPAVAEESLIDRFELHGYAHQVFLLSNSTTNNYLKADSHGSFDINALALLLSYKATDDLTIWTQLYAGNESNLRLDWAFADYRVNDWLRIRGGQIKTPLGLLNEVRDIKFIQHSTLDPYIYHEVSGIMFESFRGASAELNHGGAWGEVKLDLFGGAPVYFEGEEVEEKHYGLVGARLNYETPLPGLSIGGTIATTREQETETTETEGTVTTSGSKTIAGASLEYQQAGWHLSGEYFQIIGMEHNKYGYYGEAAYTFFDQLTPFVRYDYFTSDKDQKSDPAFYQKSLAFGVGYNFNKYAAIKVEDHIITGFALPNAEYSEENPGVLAGDKHWNLFAVSLNLMF